MDALIRARCWSCPRQRHLWRNPRRHTRSFKSRRSWHSWCWSKRIDTSGGCLLFWRHRRHTILQQCLTFRSVNKVNSLWLFIQSRCSLYLSTGITKRSASFSQECRRNSVFRRVVLEPLWHSLSIKQTLNVLICWCHIRDSFRLFFSRPINSFFITRIYSFYSTGSSWCTYKSTFSSTRPCIFRVFCHWKFWTFHRCSLFRRCRRCRHFIIVFWRIRPQVFSRLLRFFAVHKLRSHICSPAKTYGTSNRSTFS